jgi:hypothetical protein
MSAKDWTSFRFNEAEPYVLGPNSKLQDGVPKGTVTKFHHGEPVTPNHYAAGVQERAAVARTGRS